MSCLKFLSIKYIFLLFFNILIFPSIIQAANKKVAVIVPLEHEAMAQIVSGISESLQGAGSELIVKNAQGDANIMSALIKQLQEQDIDIIMPIGTTASQMTMAHIKNKPIICVAADLKSLNNPNVTGVNDEIPVTEFLTKLPPLHRIAVIYSASEKVTPEIELLKTFAEEEDIDLHLLMVQTLADLPLALKSAAADVQAFVILKDHLIVSGIKGIVQEANKRLIPVIAADEGSVKGGATIAVGVREKDIGIKSGAMAKTILAGGKPSKIPYQTIDDLVLFINKNALLKQNVFSKEEISILQLPHVEF
ncbi:ABC transporter substrate binding protein [Candidatus Trichorickettsia mobilis]|uniref:ABC transporter substrate binding protein n=1 Tax=Candidatus Trichorickettsia mobilis TaxID=1346319 RepID=A0ABZ0UU54_9RICK|nr:ABC transporter substrate binding protein [Candidatus Trichorickettsia mobilis]